MRSKYSGSQQLPPIGGADLVCMFSYSRLDSNCVRPVIECIMSQGFKLAPAHPFIVFGEDAAQPIKTAKTNSLSEFVDAIKALACRLGIVNLNGLIFDVTVAMSLRFHFEYAVLAISVPEDMIWAYTGDSAFAKYDRLQTFASYCAAVSDLLTPEFAYLGTESYQDQDLRLANAERQGIDRFSTKLFSRDRLMALFEWYTKTYARRWE